MIAVVIARAKCELHCHVGDVRMLHEDELNLEDSPLPGIARDLLVDAAKASEV